MAKDTGHGATLTLATSALAYAWRKIGATEHDRGKVEDTDLSNTNYKSYLPGDLSEPGEFEVEYIFDTTKAQSALAGLAPETITVTFPLATGQTVAGRVTGTGFVMKRTLIPELSTSTVGVGKLTIAWDGKTGPNQSVAS